MALFVNRSTRLADTTGPSAPSISAATATTSTITITRTVNSDDASGVAYYETQRAASGSGSWTTFDSSGTTPLTASGLNPSTLYDFRQRGIDAAGNAGAYSEIATTTTAASSGGNVGQVGSYAALNLASFPIYSVDMSRADYSIFATQGGIPGTGSNSHSASGWWDNSAYCRIIPPTTDQYERGIALQDLYRGASLAIQDFTMRHETRWGPSVASAVYSQSTGAKRILIHYRDTLTVGARQGRPAFFLSRSNTNDGPNAIYNRANTLVVAPATNTVPSYNDQVYTSDPNEVTSPAYSNGPQGLYIVDQSDPISSWQGKPVFKCGDFWTIEHRIISQSTAEYPRGLIAEKWTNRAGVSVERGIAFNYDTAFSLVAYLQEVQQFGCGQWNQVPAPGANVYFDIGGYITVARNFNGWLGPRTGFVTG